MTNSSRLEGDTVGVEATIRISGNNKSVSITMQFMNKENSTYKEGSVSVEENTGGGKVTSSSVTTVVDTEETGAFTTTITAKKGGTIKYKIEYNINGIKKAMYVIIKIVG